MAIVEYNSTALHLKEPLTLGQCQNATNRAYNAAMEQARANGNIRLAEALRQSLVKICEANYKALEAICDLQDKDGNSV